MFLSGEQVIERQVWKQGGWKKDLQETRGEMKVTWEVIMAVRDGTKVAGIHYLRDCQDLLVYDEKGKEKREFKATK